MKSKDLKHLIESQNKKIPYKYGNLVGGSPQGVKAIYDFHVNGGAIKAHKLLDQDGNLAVIPKGAVVKLALFDEVKTLHSANDTGRFSLGLASATDLKGATVITSLTGTVALAPVDTAASVIKMTDETYVTATLDREAITAGKFNVFIEYYFSE